MCRVNEHGIKYQANGLTLNSMRKNPSTTTTAQEKVDNFLIISIFLTPFFYLFIYLFLTCFFSTVCYLTYARFYYISFFYTSNQGSFLFFDGLFCFYGHISLRCIHFEAMQGDEVTNSFKYNTHTTFVISF